MKQILNNFLATLRRYTVSSTLNILGLGVAFASLYLIGVQVDYDLNYNRNIPDYDQVYELQILSGISQGLYSQHVSRPIAQIIIETVTGAEKVGICASNMANDVYNQNQNSDDKRAITIKSSAITNDMVDIMGLDVIEGDIEDFRSDEAQQTVIIAASTAKEFGLKVGDDLYRPYIEQFQKVVAIYSDIKGSGDFCKFKAFGNLANRSIDDFSQWSYPHYFKMNDKTTVGTSESVKAGLIKYVVDMGAPKEHAEKMFGDVDVRFMPISESYFADDVAHRTASGNKATLYTLISIAVVVLLIAFINFINFFFALVPIRIRAVNARKIFGCSRTELVVSFVAESVGLMLCALVVALFLVLAAQDSFLVGFISTSILFVDNISLFVTIATSALIVTALVALYPAYYITSFPAAMALKKGFSASRAGKALRYALIGVQFIASMVMLTYTIFTQLQYNYFLNYDIGVNKTDVLTTDLPGTLTGDIANRDNFSAKLKENSSILDVTYGDGPLVAEQSMSWGRNFGDDDNYDTYYFKVCPVSYDFLRFMGIEIIEGRDFRLEDEFSVKGSCIFNRAAMEQFKVEIGETFEGATSEAEIIGFAENFNHSSLRNVVTPMALFVFGETKWNAPSHLYVRITPDAAVGEVTEYIKAQTELYAKDFGSQYMEFQYFDEELGESYNVEKQYNRLIMLFALVSIIISLMGVFGLVLFETQFRQQEIVIRRVHGATVPEILLMINHKFLVIIGLCFVVAAPVSYFVVDRWLSTFAYHIPISAWVFVTVLAVVTLIVTSIVTVQSLKAANSNPAELIGKNA
ncbi:MAG: FtsX-like permease family protein [Rikenellaceae bacterium]